jgi:hypothetical protein
MSWITPIIDRILSDITTPTSKGYFNIADWSRINGNITVIDNILDAAGYYDISLNSLTPPDITTIPWAGDINDLIENIEILRIRSGLPANLGLTVLAYDYIGGANEIAPDYNDVNDWENNLLIIYEALPKAIDYQIHCGVPLAGNFRLWQNRFR